MQLPTPLPTDNLYKFVTILGIVVFAASVYGWVAMFSDRRAHFDKLTAELRTSTTQRAVQITDEQKAVVKELQDMSNLLGKIMGYGLGGSLVGGFFWWLLHQRHQDKLVALQVQEAEERLRQFNRDAAKARMARWRKPRA